MVTSRISRSAGAQCFGGTHRGRVCVRVFIGMSVRACCECVRCTLLLTVDFGIPSYEFTVNICTYLIF
jgi:hypothetical protein